MECLRMLFVFSVMSPKGKQKLRRLFKPHKSSICLWCRRRFVKRADLGKYGVTIGCSACSDIAVHGKKSTPQTEEWRTRIGEQMEHENADEMWNLRLVEWTGHRS